MNKKAFSSRNALLIAGAALFIGIALYAGLRSGSGGKKPRSQAVAVEIAQAGHADMPVLLQGLGTVQALNTVTVRARVDGELQRVAFSEGQLVHRGDLLAQIDPRPNQAAADQAAATLDKDRALLDNARRDLERYRLLEPQNLASQQQVDTQNALVAQLSAQVKLDQAALFNARTQLEYTRITAPIDGRAGIRLVDAGNMIRATDTGGLVVLTQIQPIDIVFTLPEEQLGAVTTAFAAGPLPVTAELRGAEAKPETGALSLIDNQVDQSTGTVKFKARFANKQERLWPGQFVTARLQLKVDRDATVIPSTAVITGPRGPFTYVVRPDLTVEARDITTAQEVDGRTVVTSGLKPGESVVTTNQYRLEPGARISSEAAGNTRGAQGK
jgi:membrane fusion protein, multidrug efflux system